MELRPPYSRQSATFYVSSGRYRSRQVPLIYSEFEKDDDEEKVATNEKREKRITRIKANECEMDELQY